MVHIGAVDPPTKARSAQPVDFAIRAERLQDRKYRDTNSVACQQRCNAPNLCGARKDLRDEETSASIRNVELECGARRVLVTGKSCRLKQNQRPKYAHRQEDRIASDNQ